MSQKHYNLEKNTKTTQTLQEIFIHFSDSKTARFYFSPYYKDYVISFTISNCRKNFIITRCMWQEFSKHLYTINNEFQR